MGAKVLMSSNAEFGATIARIPRSRIAGWAADRERLNRLSRKDPGGDWYVLRDHDVHLIWKPAGPDAIEVLSVFRKAS